MGLSLRFRAGLLVLALASFESQALAQRPGLGDATADDNRAGARAAATAGIRAMNEGRWSDAMTLFAKAEALVHAPPHLLYFARASVKLGKLVQANEAYLKIMREALPANAPKAFVEAQTAAQEEQPKVEQSLPRLTIVVEGDKASEARVTVNGEEVPAALVGIPAPHDPGDLELEAVAPGYRSEKAKLTLKEGERQTVKLTLSIKDVTAMPAPLQPTPPPAAPKTGLKVGGWITVGIGVVGLGLGTYFLIDNRNNRQAANALCNLPNNVCPSSQRSTIESYDSAANTSEILSWVGYGVGAVGVVAGVIMLVASRGSSEAPAPPKTGVTVHPWFGLGSAGLSGSF